MLVSTILSVFNSEKTVGTAIKSLQKQDYENWEAIIIDDGSTDRTAEILWHESKYDKRIKVYLNKQNYGLAKSLNRALALSSGELIARMDADDECFRNRFAEQVKFFQRNRNIDVLGALAIATQNGREVGTMHRPEKHDEIAASILRINPFIHPTVMARKHFFKKSGGYSPNLLRAQDWDLWLRTYQSAHFHNLQVPLIKYSARRSIPFKHRIAASKVLGMACVREKRYFQMPYITMRPLLALAKEALNR